MIVKAGPWTPPVGNIPIPLPNPRYATSSHHDITYHYFNPTQHQLTDPDADLIDPLCQFSGDRILLCPTFSTAQDFVSAGLTVYTYLLTHSPAYSLWGRNYTWLGATHAEDIPYVFGSPFLQHDDDGDEDWFMYGRFADDELVVAHQIMTYWTNFAKTGSDAL